MDRKSLNVASLWKGKHFKVRCVQINRDVIVNFLAAAFSLFYLYTALFGQISPQIHRGLYVGFTYILCFLLYPIQKRKLFFIDVILITLTIIISSYWIINFPNLAYRAGTIVPTDILLGWILIILSLEVSRRALGLGIPIIAFFFLLYSYFGPYFPGDFGHPGVPLTRLSYYMYVTIDGIYGQICEVFATFVFIFVIFGSFIERSGGARLLIDLPLALTGRFRGGPAKAAVVASGLMGSVSGSTVANVVTTGTFTIPLMKKLGFKPETAAAIETSASTGGQLMPPIMGAGAFVMSEFTGVPYLDIIKVAAVPALMYYVGLMVIVHTQAKKEGVEVLPVSERQNAKRIIKEAWYYIIPIFVILYLLISGYSPGYSGASAVVATFLISLFRKETMMTPAKLYTTLAEGAKNSLVFGSTTGSIGIIIGVIFLTGTGLKFTDIMLSLSKGILPLAILLVAVASYVLGMGTTVLSSYIIIAVLASPALQELGVSLIAAHMLIFWYSQDANITPPVCVAAFAAAGVAKADPMKTGFKALIFAKPLYIIPVLFIYTPLLFEGTPSEVVMAMVSSTLGIIAVSFAIQFFYLKPMNVVEIFLMLASSILFFMHDFKTDGIAILLFGIVTASQMIGMKKEARGQTNRQITADMERKQN